MELRRFRIEVIVTQNFNISIFSHFANSNNYIRLFHMLIILRKMGVAYGSMSCLLLISVSLRFEHVFELVDLILCGQDISPSRDFASP